ncbi:sigma factor [Microbacterium oryzae]|uniref:RNA polymerase sigma factor n=1 Tax=Microbacterium oryzae TaxID=743009 RepID=UPI0025B110A4|nr:DUF6596 domain-containing protein [Microbacterium oryzae]MDN3310152.1 sigma factor [Microbacterium oryzae]
MSGAADEVRRAVTAVWRAEAARIVATLTRYTGDFSLAEDLAQEAVADALAQWPRSGIPRNGAAWLTTAAKHKAIDVWRRRERYDARVVALAHALDEAQPDADPWDPDEIDDDVLRLVFVACHPVLAPPARVALALRAVAGLEADEIARAFLVPTATVQQRIVRAKRALAEAGVQFEVPLPEERPTRVAAVLAVLYLVFNEGHSASSGQDLLRPDLAREAIRLARILAALLPREPEVHGLLALMELTASRFPARTDARGEPVLLADQDRRRWDRAAIARGRAALARVDLLGRGRGPYALQAAIAQCHAVAPDVAGTDWALIVRLYEALAQVAPSPIVDLNRAVAVAEASGPDAGLRIVDELVAGGRLRTYHLLPAVRGELLARLGRDEEARAEFADAAALVRNERERAALQARAAATGAPTSRAR